MRKSTQDLLIKFTSIDWLSNVGETIQKMAYPVRQLKSWDEVAEFVGSDDWSQAASDLSNDMGGELFKLKMEGSYQYDWNEVPNKVRPIVVDLVKQKLLNLVEENTKNYKPISDCFQWYLMYWIIETEHSHVLESGFYRRLGEIFQLGHFPCGWDTANGEDSCLVVY